VDEYVGVLLLLLQLLKTIRHGTQKKKEKRVVAGIYSCPYHLAIVAVVAV